MLRITLKKTRRFVHTVVTPRPIPTFPKSSCWTCSRYRNNTCKVLRCSAGIATGPCCRRKILPINKRNIQLTKQHPMQEINAQPISLAGVDNLEREREAVESSLPSARTLRSYRTMKHRSISDTIPNLEKNDQTALVARPENSTKLRLRRRKRIVSCPGNAGIALYRPVSDYVLDNLRRRTVSDGHHQAMQVKDPLSSDSDDGTNGSSLYITACSYFTEPAEVERYQPIMQVLDIESGAVFQKILQGSGGEIPASQVGVEVLNTQGNNVSCQVMPPAGLKGASSGIQPSGLHLAPIPSLMLTIPTPQLPISPIFLPQSPITVSKFVTATTRPSVSPVRASPVPSIPICEDCCLIPPESGQQCPSCERQWLACKVWYQANDGGRRERLTEPFIKPAESNAANRALLELLGAPTGSGSAYGLGIRAVPEPVVSKSRFRKLAPLLALATADTSTSIVSGLATTAGPGVVLKKLGLQAFKTSLRRFWAELTLRVRCGSVNFLKAFLLVNGAKLSASGSSLRGSFSSGDYLGDAQSYTQPPRRLAITSTSRFLEHLVELRGTP